MTDDTTQRVTTVDRLESEPQRVTIDDKMFLICKVDGEVRAYRNICPHQYGPVVEGRIDDKTEQVICPWHGWVFDLDTGQNPLIDMSLSCVDTIVEEGDVYLDL